MELERVLTQPLTSVEIGVVLQRRLRILINVGARQGAQVANAETSTQSLVNLTFQWPVSAYVDLATGPRVESTAPTRLATHAGVRIGTVGARAGVMPATWPLGISSEHRCCRRSASSRCARPRRRSLRSH